MQKPRTEIELVETRWGPMYVFANDLGVSEALRYFGEYGAPEIGIYERILETTGEVFVDVGTNIGVLSKGLAAGPRRARIIGFEPQVACYRLAIANLLPHDNASLYPIAVSDRSGAIETGEIDTRRSGNYGGVALATVSGAPRVPCPMVRLDEFLARRAPKPRLVKIDVEGMEAAVLRGMRGLVHDRLAISVEADRRENVPEMLTELDAMNCAKFAFFVRPVSEKNPRFDPALRHCRSRHVHLLGFVDAPPSWALEMPGLWPIGDAQDFDRLWGKYFPAGASID